MITYSYKNLTPYGAADIYCMDQYLPEGFKGNAVEYLLKEGFTIEQKGDRFYMKFPTSYAQFIVKKDGE